MQLQVTGLRYGLASTRFTKSISRNKSNVETYDY